MAFHHVNLFNIITRFRKCAKCAQIINYSNNFFFLIFNKFLIPKIKIIIKLIIILIHRIIINRKEKFLKRKFKKKE